MVRKTNECLNGTAGELQNDSIQKDLIEQGYAYDFFQAVRLLCIEAAHDGDLDSCMIGIDNVPHNEVARFRANVSHRYSSGEISKVEAPEPDENADDDFQPPLEMSVNFLGITGPSGVLPSHYTEMVINRVRNDDFAMRNFFDLFHHRMISHFYRAWLKYRLPFSYEYSRLREREEDDISNALFALSGMATDKLQGRLAFDDIALIEFGGLYSNQSPSAMSLERMLADFFQLPVSLKQFQREWLYLDPEDQTQLGSPCALGENTIVGQRVASIENRFRIQVGPLTLEQFKQFSPESHQLRSAADMVRSFIGVGLDFDFQVILRKEDVPGTLLGGDSDSGSRLGWNSWTKSVEFENDAYDAIYELDPIPQQVSL